MIISDFAGTLDWIFVDGSKMDAKPVIPGYDEATLSAYIALPSEHFPSDHVAIGADITMKTSKSS